MAQLPPDGDWLVQQIDDTTVAVIHRYSEERVVSFNPTDANAAALAQRTIFDSDRLTDEQKCFAHFWCGYFYAHSN